jgi:hypothetical protein
LNVGHLTERLQQTVESAQVRERKREMKKLHRKWYFFFFYFLFSFFSHLPDLLLLPIIIIIIIITTTMGTKKQQRWAKKLNLATIVRSLFVLQTTTGADGEEF